jgi:hypothetical protein
MSRGVAAQRQEDRQMGPSWDTVSVTVTKTEAERIKEIRERHPGWDINRVFGGWEAIPEGMAVVRAVYLDTIEEKLEALEANGDLAGDHSGQRSQTGRSGRVKP